MSIIAKATSNSVPVSEGAHIAICVSIIDLGMQTVQWQGTIKEQHKVMLTWEIPDETILVDGEERPRVISKEYTLSLNEKAKLREHLEAWRGKKFSDDELDGFDLQNVLGKPCLLQVLHNDRGYANISAVMSVPKGTTVAPSNTETTCFDLSDPGWLTIMDRLPEWIKDKIKQSTTYLNLVEAQSDSDDDFREITSDEDLPF